MVSFVSSQIKEEKEVEFISGGSAYSDHVAVKMYLSTPDSLNSSLTLFLPCKWNGNEFDPSSKEGYVLNKLHRMFSLKVYGNKDTSLNELKEAISRGARWFSYSSFYSRNDYLVSYSNKKAYMIAFGNTPTLTSTGTSYTFNKYKGEKEYVQV
jgi:hypothetical protein